MPVYVWFPSLAGVTVGYSFMNIPPIADQFMDLFGVGYAGLSFFLSALLWSHSMFQVPAGLLVDRFTPYRTLFVSTALAVLFNLLPFAAPDSLVLACLMRFCLGLCTGQVYLSALKIIAAVAPKDQTSNAQGYYGGLFSLGTMFPYFTLPYFGESAWRYAYGICAVMYSLLLLSVFLLPKDKAPPPTETPIGSGRVLRTVLVSRDIWLLGALHGVSYATLTNLGQWMPSILADLSDEPIAAWTVATTLVLLVGSFSRMFSGRLVRWTPRKNLVNGMLWMSGMMFVLLGAADRPLLSLALALVLAVVSGISYGSLFTLAGRLLAPVYMATALGVYSTTANLVNAALTLLLGNIRERTGAFSWGLVAAGLVSLAVWILSRKSVARIDDTVD